MALSAALEALQHYIWLPIVVAVLLIYLVSMLFFSKSETPPPTEFPKPSHVPMKLSAKAKKEKQQAKKKAKKALKAMQKGTTKNGLSEESEGQSTGMETTTDGEENDGSASRSGSPLQTSEKKKKKSKRATKEVEYKEDVVIISPEEPEKSAMEGEETAPNETSASGSGKKKKRNKNKKSSLTKSEEETGTDTDVRGSPLSHANAVTKTQSILKNADEHSPVAPEPQRFAHVKVPKDEIELAKMKHGESSQSALGDDVHSTSSKESKSMKKRNKKKLREEEAETSVMASPIMHTPPQAVVNVKAASEGVREEGVHPVASGATQAAAPLPNGVELVTEAPYKPAEHTTDSGPSLFSQLQQKTHEVSSLTKEVNRLKRTLENREAEMIAHREEIRELHQIRSEYAMLKDTQAKFSNMEKGQRILQEQFSNKVLQVTTLEDENKKLKKRLEEGLMKVNHAEIEKKLSALESENSQLKMHLHTAQTSAMDKDIESKTLRGELQELYRQRDAYISEKDNELKKLQADCNRLSYELKQEKFRVEEAAKEVYLAQQQRSVEQEELRQLKQIASSIGDYNRLSAELENVRAQLKEKLDLEASLREELNKREHQQRHALEAKEQELREHLAQVSMQREEGDSALQSKLEALEVSCRELTSARENLEKKLADALDQKAAHEHILSEKEQEINSAKEQQHRLAEELEKIKSDLSAAHSQAHSHMEEKTTLQQQLQETQKRLEEIQLQHQCAIEEADARNRTLQEQSQQASNASEEMNKIREELEVLRNKEKEEHERVTALTSEREELQKSVKELQDTLAAEKAHREKAEESYREKERESADLREQFRGREEAEQWYKQERDELEKRVEEIGLEKEKSQAHYQELLHNTEDVLHKLQNSVQEEEGKWKANLASSEQQCMQLRETISRLENSSGENEKRIQELSQSLSTLQGDLNAANESKQYNENRVQELSHTLSTLEGILNAANADKQQLEQRVQELSQNLATLQGDLNTANEAKQQSEQRIHELNQTLTTLQGELNTANEAKQRSEEHAHQLNQTMSTLQGDLSGVNEAKQRLSGELDQVRAALSTELEASRNVIEKLQQEINALNEQQKLNYSTTTNESEQYHDESSSSLNDSQDQP